MVPPNSSQAKAAAGGAQSGAPPRGGWTLPQLAGAAAFACPPARCCAAPPLAAAQLHRVAPLAATARSTGSKLPAAQSSPPRHPGCRQLACCTCSNTPAPAAHAAMAAPLVAPECWPNAAVLPAVPPPAVAPPRCPKLAAARPTASRAFQRARRKWHSAPSPQMQAMPEVQHQCSSCQGAGSTARVPSHPRSRPRRPHLEALVQHAPLPLDAHVLGPLDKAAHVALARQVAANACGSGGSRCTSGAGHASEQRRSAPPLHGAAVQPCRVSLHHLHCPSPAAAPKHAPRLRGRTERLGPLLIERGDGRGGGRRLLHGGGRRRDLLALGCLRAGGGGWGPQAPAASGSMRRGPKAGAAPGACSRLPGALDAARCVCSAPGRCRGSSARRQWHVAALAAPGPRSPWWGLRT